MIVFLPLLHFLLVFSPNNNFTIVLPFLHFLFVDRCHNVKKGKEASQITRRQLLIKLNINYLNKATINNLIKLQLNKVTRLPLRNIVTFMKMYQTTV